MASSKTKQKYYVVWVGITPGVYDSWPACEKQVNQYVGAKYKSYPSRSEAELAYKAGVPFMGSKPSNKTVIKESPTIGIAVDAACSGVPGPVEWRGVSLADGQEVFRSKVYDHGTNNVGEFIAIVDGMRWLAKHEKNWPIYSDSTNALLWVKKKVCNTNLTRIPKNEALFQQIEAAELYLDERPKKIIVKKWQTEEWGENPADFGRK